MLLPGNPPRLASSVLKEHSRRPPVNDLEDVEQQVEPSPTDIRRAAMNMLARREHSSHELHLKMGRRFADRVLVDEVLAQLIDDGLQSDSRFTRMFIRSRAHRGIGPNRVRRELSERGVDADTIECGFEASEVDWQALHRRVLHKRFGSVAAAA